MGRFDGTGSIGWPTMCRGGDIALYTGEPTRGGGVVDERWFNGLLGGRERFLRAFVAGTLNGRGLQSICAG